MSERFRVETPEQVTLAFDVAGIGSRSVAALVDTALLLIVTSVIGVIVGEIGRINTLTDNLVLAIGSVVTFAFVWFYYIVFDLAWNGSSPGKRLVGLRVVQGDGRPIQFLGSVIRNTIRIADFLPLGYPLGLLTMFIDRRARRLGDLAADTLVVRVRRPVALADLIETSPPALSLASISALHLDDYQLIGEFLAQREMMDPAARTQIAIDLASGLRRRLGIGPVAYPEAFISYVADQYRALLIVPAAASASTVEALR